MKTTIRTLTLLAFVFSAFDICTYDEGNQQYVYHFDRLVNRINRITEGGTEIYQLVFDQRPWAFQRGYTFIPEGERDGIHLIDPPRVTKSIAIGIGRTGCIEGQLLANLGIHST